MKNFIQSILGIFGVRLIRSKYARKYLPKPCVDNVEIIMRFFHMINRKINVLQIGACDGVTSDSIYSFIKAGSINAFLVEPGTINFKKLSQFYLDTRNVTLINAAVAERDETRTFYTIKDEGRWADSGWARQLASFYKEHLLKHGIEQNEIAEEKVNCMTLKTIVNRYAISDLEVLLIDTEGFDGEIVKMALSEGILPNFLVFENAQLVQNYTQAELDDLYVRLKDNGYVWTHDRINTMAVKKTFLKI